MFNWNKIKKPAIVLAPMANITTLPFRSICKEMGADITYTPMISSNAIIHNPQESLKIAEFLPQEQPVIVQIFGYDGELITKAANIVNDKLKPAGIDINMGCPAPKIAHSECGAALLKNYDKAKKIIKKIRSGFSGQLSVKLRLGWDKFDVLPFVRYLEKIGVDSVSIHGRTAKQGFRGSADWQAIYKIARCVKIPVIGNGDIIDSLTAYRLLVPSKVEGWLTADGCLAGIMIGRAALGNPWIFREIKNHLNKVTLEHGNINILEQFNNLTKKQNNKRELIKVIDEQTKRYIDYAGEKTAIREMRKHLGWYIKGFPGALEIRKKAIRVETYQDVKKILELI